MTEDELNEDMVRALAKQTAALPREIEPPVDAWARIRDTIESERIIPIAAARRAKWWQNPQFLVAAGVILVAGSAFTTSMIINGGVKEGPVMTMQGEAPYGSNVQSLAQFTALENDYIATANQLTAILDSHQSDLAPETVAKLKESVRVIDAAIIEARRALAQDPSNKALMEMLSASYMQKVDLLKRTTAMGET